MGNLLKGLLSWFAAGFWWLLDRLYGDALFARVRPMIPDLASDLDAAVSLLVSYGPPLIFALLGVYFFWSGRRQIRSMTGTAPAKSVHPSEEPTKFTENDYAEDDEGSLPGLTANLVVEFDFQREIRRKHVFEYKADGLAKVALYMSASDRLTFMAVDKFGEPYPLEIPTGRGGIPMRSRIFINVELGIASGYTVLRARTNGNLRAERTLNFPLQIGMIRWHSQTLGSSVAGVDHGKFKLFFYLAREYTLSRQELHDLTGYLERKFDL